MESREGKFSLVLITAWNDSGGGYTHRLFDGHPEFYVYPFEMQLGTKQTVDKFSDWFHSKYRWPVFSEPIDELSPEEIFNEIIDDEVKSTSRDQLTSKFRGFDLRLDISEWRQEFTKSLSNNTSVSRGNIVEAYIKSLFFCWKNRKLSGKERLTVGHCPITNIDIDCILSDFPDVKIIHVVRNPLCGFVDMRLRRPEVNIKKYCEKWNIINTMAFISSYRNAENLKIVNYNGLLNEKKEIMTELCGWLGVEYDPVLLVPTWNGVELTKIYPFGGVNKISATYEESCKNELSEEERQIIRESTAGTRELLNESGIEIPVVDKY